MGSHLGSYFQLTN